MALSGNLNDFDISYIFQIIAQENKTGKLVLTSDNNEGYVVFKKGLIISAVTNKQNIKSMIYNYLINVKRFPKKEINELDSLVKNNLRFLSQELIEKKYVTFEELSTLAALNIEDIACSIFLWKNGNYTFDSLQNVDNLQICNYSTTAEAITMEAVRQMDEIERMAEFIKPETVFIRQNSSNNYYNNGESPLENISQYLLFFINGVTTTESLCKKTFVSEFRVYETLFELLKNGIINPLPHKTPNDKGIKQNELTDSKEPIILKVFISTIITSTILGCIYLIGIIFLNGFIFSKSITEQHNALSEYNRLKANQKIAIATLQYRANFGKKPLFINDLTKSKILAKRDFKDLEKKQ